jgi:hypothetical protein
MSSSAWQVHRFWVVRAALVLLVTALAEVVVVRSMQQPIRWVALVAGTLPLSLLFFVGLPLIRREARPS